MNFLQKFLDFVRSPTHSRTTAVIVLFLILAAIPLTVIISQQQQELRQRAAENQYSCKIDFYRSIDRCVGSITNTNTFSSSTDQSHVCDDTLTAVSCTLPAGTTSLSPTQTLLPTPIPFDVCSSFTSCFSCTREGCAWTGDPSSANVTYYCKKATASCPSGGQFLFLTESDCQSKTNKCVPTPTPTPTPPSPCFPNGKFCREGNRITVCENSVFSNSPCPEGKTCVENTQGSAECKSLPTPTPIPQLIQCNIDTDEGQFRCRSNCFLNEIVVGGSTTCSLDKANPVCCLDRSKRLPTPTPIPTSQCGVNDCGGPGACAVGSSCQQVAGAFTKQCTCQSSAPPTPTSPLAPTPACPLKSKGDADCNGVINIVDFNVWRDEFTGKLKTTTADFNNDGILDIKDFSAWRDGFIAENAKKK